jgi:hypothetical protein
MATGRRKTPDFFKEEGIDPVETATGYPQKVPANKTATASGAKSQATTDTGMVAKKKAGFYLSVDILNRFTLKFHELKLAGIPIENKSTLLEAALDFALDDIDKGEGSRVLQQFGD